MQSTTEFLIEDYREFITDTSEMLTRAGFLEINGEAFPSTGGKFLHFRKYVLSDSDASLLFVSRLDAIPETDCKVYRGIVECVSFSQESVYVENIIGPNVPLRQLREQLKPGKETLRRIITEKAAMSLRRAGLLPEYDSAFLGRILEPEEELELSFWQNDKQGPFLQKVVSSLAQCGFVLKKNMGRASSEAKARGGALAFEYDVATCLTQCGFSILSPSGSIIKGDKPYTIMAYENGQVVGELVRTGINTEGEFERIPDVVLRRGKDGKYVVDARAAGEIVPMVLVYASQLNSWLEDNTEAKHAQLASMVEARRDWVSEGFEVSVANLNLG